MESVQEDREMEVQNEMEIFGIPVVMITSLTEWAILGSLILLFTSVTILKIKAWITHILKVKETKKMKKLLLDLVKQTLNKKFDIKIPENSTDDKDVGQYHVWTKEENELFAMVQNFKKMKSDLPSKQDAITAEKEFQKEVLKDFFATIKSGKKQNFNWWKTWLQHQLKTMGNLGAGVKVTQDDLN